MYQFKMYKNFAPDAKQISTQKVNKVFLNNNNKKKNCIETDW